MRSFDGITALVTGASSGLGLAIAHELVNAGARTVITGTNPDKLEFARSTFSDPESVLALQFDVTDEGAWSSAESTVRGMFGPIQFLALNAGVGMGGDRIEETPSAVWTWAWQVNVMGVVNGIRACLPAMRQHGLQSHVMVTSSVAGVWRCPSVGAYAVSKSAVVALMESLRLELADSAISCSVLLPGRIHTDLPETSMRSAPLEMSAATIAAMKAFLAEGREPSEIARFALERVRAGAFYVFTHPQVDGEVAERQAELTSAIPITLPS